MNCFNCDRPFFDATSELPPGNKKYCQCKKRSGGIIQGEGMKPHYSGPNSMKFWKRINKLSGARNDAAYTLGVVLQNLERDVLRLIELFEKNEKEKV
jgi:hypothetical protein